MEESCLDGRIYFAHPIRAEAAKLHTGYMECKDCKRLVMEPLFYRLIRECPYVLYWNPLGTCGAKCELELAKQLQKHIVYYRQQNNRES